MTNITNYQGIYFREAITPAQTGAVSALEATSQGSIGAAGATAAVGGALFGASAVAAGYNAYELATQWKELKPIDKGLKVTEFTANTTITAGGASVLIGKVHAIAAKLGIAPAAATKLAAVGLTILAPIGLATLAGLAIYKAGESIYKLHRTVKANTDNCQTLNKAAKRFFIDTLKYLALATALILAAGALAGLFATPLGWALVLGLVGGFFVLHATSLYITHGVHKRMKDLSEKKPPEQNQYVSAESDDLRTSSTDLSSRSSSHSSGDEAGRQSSGSDDLSSEQPHTHIPRMPQEYSTYGWGAS